MHKQRPLQTMRAWSLPMAAAVLAAAVILFMMKTQPAASAIVEHTFVVSQVNMTHLCKEVLTTVVNGQLPGPAIEVTEGDLVVVNVVNKSPYNITIHWHGVKQRLNCWADGVPTLTQLPILPNQNFTYRFDVSGQEGTLWWHAHVPCLRATLHGALIIRPRLGVESYPFPKPHQEIPIIIGEWWEVDLQDVDRQLRFLLPDSVPEFYYTASTINGKLGDLYNCSGVHEDGFVLDVEHGKTYLLRVINAALYNEYYLKIAGHKFTVVAADANYIKPYTTDIIAVAPGETVDALVVADAPPGRYYMVAKPNQAPLPEFQAAELLTRGMVLYSNNQSSGNIGAAVSSFRADGGESTMSGDMPMIPEMPDEHDSITSFYFHGNLTNLHQAPHLQVPMLADEHLFITLALGTVCRDGRQFCTRMASLEDKVLATMNNISFQFPFVETSLLEMHYYNSSDMYTFQVLPDRPPMPFNYTDETLIPLAPKEAQLEPTSQATVVRRFRYGATVEVVFQNTALMSSDPNPMHLHGHNMFVLAQGIGIYNATRDVQRYNLVDPPVRNTVQVPRLGWAAVRFVADNPGIWYIHCHYEFHMTMGMAAIFIVENGPTVDTTLPPPPSDFLDNLVLRELYDVKI